MKKDALFKALLAVALILPAGPSLGKEAAEKAADPYAGQPSPLTVVQCGQCHPGIFRNIKEDGGRHRIRCQRCHEQFHAYNPVRDNWAELMPKCARCHDQPHGEQLVDCLQCHTNPHTPLQVAMNGTLTAACGQCHSQPAKAMHDFPSAHAAQGCEACHQAHGAIPSCLECHAPHVEGQPAEACLACHPAHKPLQVVYDSTAESATCGACHSGVYATWRKTESRHGKVDCAECHASHGLIPECRSCHGLPHDASLLSKFPACLDCHLDPHDLPVKQ